MKKIALFLLILSGIITSCKKFLDTKPTDFIVPEQYYNTEQQLNEALAGVYSSLTTVATYGLQQNFYLVGTTDESYYKLSTTSPHPLYYNITPAEPRTSNTWNDLYKGIDRANYLLANINKPAMDEQRRNAIKGEALFLRAYMYYLLVTQWGDVPLLLTPTVDGRQVNNPATPAKDIYNQVYNDMKTAKDLVNDYTTNGTPVHVSKTAVEAMLARVCLKMAGEPLLDVAKYTDARAWADSVIQSHVHSLNPDYKQIFINENADQFDNAYKEVLWEIDFYGNNIGALQAGGRWSIYMGVRNTDKDIGYSYGYQGATGYLYKLYSAGDLRRDWAISPYNFLGNSGTTKVLVVPTDAYSRNEGKWRREYETVLPRNTEFSPTNYPIIRYSDVLLMFAEADNEINGPTARSFDALNMVRRRGFGLSVTTPAVSVSVVKDITLSATGNTGYLKTVATIPVTLSGGGGTGASATASVSTTTGKVTAIAISNPGLGYTSIPTVTVGTPWQPNTSYPAGTQVFNGNNLYTVATTGSSTTTAPTQTSGTSDPNLTGIGFTYAGAKATGTASIATATVDLNGLSQAAFRTAIRDERARELCFEGIRKFDLIRWGIFIPQMKMIEADMNANLPASLKYAVREYTNVSEKDKLFPIPTLELSLNSALQQNPLWK
ncbi:RagB/SusD family nutrient uptake outer membrane protein [Flavisolibacter ginsenosidimutans]|uniref:RagB/SusD family nutrient uptake outer membrane protein n=1 Tax=Flavisolibacter ginsenosidimutans TaxID=661481 RepID=A0A5B8UIG5_9BACT|nr:RagB/SusD family nutrient uptake outer membrane protein [Flavisolibacter ginsenosidimutans]QEC56323.1 RagB/SusD family nutrient uptake outer membrane protein [Flavisolibacter ginsenosidimutans]